MKRSGLISASLARQSRKRRSHEASPDAPLPILPPEKFRFSRVKDNPLKAIVQRFALATILILVISLITDRTALDRLRTAIAGLGTHNAAEAIAAEVIRLARA